MRNEGDSKDESLGLAEPVCLETALLSVSLALSVSVYSGRAPVSNIRPRKRKTNPEDIAYDIRKYLTSSYKSAPWLQMGTAFIGSTTQSKRCPTRPIVYHMHIFAS